jgi:hypothetical protein
LIALAKAYEQLYGASISRSSISEYFRAAGYRFKKAKKVLTSGDPQYREKLTRLRLRPTRHVDRLGLRRSLVRG